jgi:hypothetical protein
MLADRGDTRESLAILHFGIKITKAKHRLSRKKHHGGD